MHTPMNSLKSSPFCPSLLISESIHEHTSQERATDNRFGIVENIAHGSFVQPHLTVVGRKSIGQVQNSTRMTRVNQNSAIDSLSHRLHQHLQNVVVDDLTASFKVHWNERRVVTIFFIARDISHTATVTRVMNKDNIAGLRILTDTRKCIFNVALRRFVLSSVVHKNEHFTFIEALLINEVFLDVVHIVVTSRLSVPNGDGRWQIRNRTTSAREMIEVHATMI